MSQFTPTAVFDINRMWKGGPLRQFAMERPHGGWGIPYQGGGFAGQYVCDQCQRPTTGVSLSNDGAAWLCDGCNNPRKAKS